MPKVSSQQAGSLLGVLDLTPDQLSARAVGGREEPLRSGPGRSGMGQEGRFYGLAVVGGKGVQGMASLEAFY